MKGNDEAIIMRSHDNYDSMSTRTAATKHGQQDDLDGTDSIQTNLMDNDDVINARLCRFGKTLHASFRKDYVNQLLTAG